MVLLAFSHIGRVSTRVWTLKQAVSTFLCSTTRSSVARSLASWDLISWRTVIALLRMDLLYKKRRSEDLPVCQFKKWFTSPLLSYRRSYAPSYLTLNETQSPSLYLLLPLLLRFPFLIHQEHTLLSYHLHA